MTRLLKDGIITTLFGLAVMGVAIYLYVSKDHDNETAAAVGVIGLIFLRSKDSLIGLGSK